MAYFSNGSEGMVLDEQCAQCPVANDACCPILYIQMTYNYKQLDSNGEETLASEVMNCLVDENGTCQMKPIIENRLVDKNQGDLFQE